LLSEYNIDYGRFQYGSLSGGIWPSDYVVIRQITVILDMVCIENGVTLLFHFAYVFFAEFSQRNAFCCDVLADSGEIVDKSFEPE